VVFPRRKNGMKTMIANTAMNGSMRFETSCRQSSVYAAAGNARKVTELIDVPSIDNPMTQPGNDRPPRKYSSVVLLRRENHRPNAAIPSR